MIKQWLLRKVVKDGIILRCYFSLFLLHRIVLRLHASSICLQTELLSSFLSVDLSSQISSFQMLHFAASTYYRPDIIFQTKWWYTHLSFKLCFLAGGNQLHWSVYAWNMKHIQTNQNLAWTQLIPMKYPSHNICLCIQNWKWAQTPKSTRCMFRFHHLAFEQREM